MQGTKYFCVAIDAELVERLGGADFDSEAVSLFESFQRKLQLLAAKHGGRVVGVDSDGRIDD